MVLQQQSLFRMNGFNDIEGSQQTFFVALNLDVARERSFKLVAKLLQSVKQQCRKQHHASTL